MDRDAIRKLPDPYRSYIPTITEAEIDGTLRASADSPDIIQQTCLSAIGEIGDFDWSNQAQFVAWLKRVHCRNVQDTIRKHKKIGRRAIAGVSIGHTSIRSRFTGVPSSGSEWRCVAYKKLASLKCFTGCLQTGRQLFSYNASRTCIVAAGSGTTPVVSPRAVK